MDPISLTILALGALGVGASGAAVGVVGSISGYKLLNSKFIETALNKITGEKEKKINKEQMEKFIHAYVSNFSINDLSFWGDSEVNKEIFNKDDFNFTSMDIGKSDSEKEMDDIYGLAVLLLEKICNFYDARLKKKNDSSWKYMTSWSTQEYINETDSTAVFLFEFNKWLLTITKWEDPFTLTHQKQVKKRILFLKQLSNNYGKETNDKIKYFLTVKVVEIKGLLDNGIQNKIKNINKIFCQKLEKVNTNNLNVMDIDEEKKNYLDSFENDMKNINLNELGEFINSLMKWLTSLKSANGTKVSQSLNEEIKNKIKLVNEIITEVQRKDLVEIDVINNISKIGLHLQTLLSCLEKSNEIQLNQTKVILCNIYSGIFFGENIPDKFLKLDKSGVKLDEVKNIFSNVVAKIENNDEGDTELKPCVTNIYNNLSPEIFSNFKGFPVVQIFLLDLLEKIPQLIMDIKEDVLIKWLEKMVNYIGQIEKNCESFTSSAEDKNTLNPATRKLKFLVLTLRKNFFDVQQMLQTRMESRNDTMGLAWVQHDIEDLISHLHGIIRASIEYIAKISINSIAFPKIAANSIFSIKETDENEQEIFSQTNLAKILDSLKSVYKESKEPSDVVNIVPLQEHLAKMELEISSHENLITLLDMDSMSDQEGNVIKQMDENTKRSIISFCALLVDAAYLASLLQLVSKQTQLRGSILLYKNPEKGFLGIYLCTQLLEELKKRMQEIENYLMQTILKKQSNDKILPLLKNWETASSYYKIISDAQKKAEKSIGNIIKGIANSIILEKINLANKDKNANYFYNKLNKNIKAKTWSEIYDAISYIHTKDDEINNDEESKSGKKDENNNQQNATQDNENGVDNEEKIEEKITADYESIKENIFEYEIKFTSLLKEEAMNLATKDNEFYEFIINEEGKGKYQIIYLEWKSATETSTEYFELSIDAMDEDEETKKMYTLIKESQQKQSTLASKKLKHELVALILKRLNKSNFSEEQELIINSYEHARKARGKKIIPVTGATGAGKSTIIDSLIGHEMMIDESDLFNSQVIISEKSKKKFGYAKIGTNALESQTLFTKIYTVTNNGEKYHLCDCPGLHDTRGVETRVAIFIGLKTLIKSAADIRAVIFAMNGGPFLINDKAVITEKVAGITKITASLSDVFSDITKLRQTNPETLSSILFLFTHIDNEKILQKAYEGNLSFLIKSLENLVKSPQSKQKKSNTDESNDETERKKCSDFLSFLSGNITQTIATDFLNKLNKSQQQDSTYLEKTFKKLKETKKIPKDALAFRSEEGRREFIQLLLAMSAKGKKLLTSVDDLDSKLTENKWELAEKQSHLKTLKKLLDGIEKKILGNQTTTLNKKTFFTDTPSISPQYFLDTTQIEQSLQKSKEEENEISEKKESLQRELETAQNNLQTFLNKHEQYYQDEPYLPLEIHDVRMPVFGSLSWTSYKFEYDDIPFKEVKHLTKKGTNGKFLTPTVNDPERGKYCVTYQSDWGENGDAWLDIYVDVNKHPVSIQKIKNYQLEINSLKTRINELSKELFKKTENSKNLSDTLKKVNDTNQEITSTLNNAINNLESREQQIKNLEKKDNETKDNFSKAIDNCKKDISLCKQKQKELQKRLLLTKREVENNRKMFDKFLEIIELLGDKKDQENIFAAKKNGEYQENTGDRDSVFQFFSQWHRYKKNHSNEKKANEKSQQQFQENIQEKTQENKSKEKNDDYDNVNQNSNLIELNAVGSDRNLGQDGDDPTYWYGINDGLRLVMWMRKNKLNYTNKKNEPYQIKGGEEYSSIRQNNQSIYLSDPVYIEQLENSFLGDMQAITGRCPEEEKIRNNPWSEKPQTLNIPLLLSAFHWVSIRIQINYQARTVDILYDDPFGYKLPEYSWQEIINKLAPGIKLLLANNQPTFEKDFPDFKLSKDNVTKRCKKIDQQGKGKNAWDCGPITFANVEDYIDSTQSNEVFANSNLTNNSYTVSAATTTNHSTQMKKIRDNDISRYNEVSGVKISSVHAKQFKKQEELVQKGSKNKLSAVKMKNDSLIEKLDKLTPYEICLLTILIDSKRQALKNKQINEQIDMDDQYTEQEVQDAYNEIAVINKKDVKDKVEGKNGDDEGKENKKDNFIYQKPNNNVIFNQGTTYESEPKQYLPRDKF